MTATQGVPRSGAETPVPDVLEASSSAPEQPQQARFTDRCRRILTSIKAVLARIDLSDFPGSCCG